MIELDNEEVSNVSTICIQYSQLMIVLVLVITFTFKTSEWHQMLKNMFPLNLSPIVQQICDIFWPNCGFDDKSMTFGTLLEYTFLVIFGYRAIADLTCDKISNMAAIYSRQKRFCLGKLWYILVLSGFWPSMGSLLIIRWVSSLQSWGFWEIQDGFHFTEMAITSFLFVTDGSFLHLSLCFMGQPIHWTYSLFCQIMTSPANPIWWPGWLPFGVLLEFGW